jgi:hypothetical protein
MRRARREYGGRVVCYNTEPPSRLNKEEALNGPRSTLHPRA